MLMPLPRRYEFERCTGRDEHITAPDDYRADMTLNTDAMTWTALLSNWLEFAQASLTLPRDAEGKRWRQSVVSVITLQAVTFALRDLDRLPSAERPYARDKAEVLIDEHAETLRDIWRQTPMPAMIREVLQDARGAFARAAWAGVQELTWRGSQPTVIPDLSAEALCDQLVNDGRGALAIAQPGTYIMPGEPLAWWCDLDNAELTLRNVLPDGKLSSPPFPRQVVRQIQPDGRILRDVITSIDRDDIDGLPLLVPLIGNGQCIGLFTLDADEWREAQREQLEDRCIEVIDLTGESTTDAETFPG